MNICRMEKGNILVLVVTMIMMASPVFGASIVGSRHDFSDSGTSGFSGATEYDDGFNTAVDEVCVFCHTPHGASMSIPGVSGPEGGPLWNRTNTSSAYSFSVYASATLNATVSLAPTGSSAMCMSCHDGVTSISVNTLLNSPGEYPLVWTGLGDGTMGGIYSPAGFLGYYGPNIGNTYVGGSMTIDLSNDHPVSFDWPASLDPGLRDPSLIDPALRLFGAGKRMECATCHQVHDPTNVPFLAMDNGGSAMCLQCHIK